MADSPKHTPQELYALALQNNGNCQRVAELTKLSRSSVFYHLKRTGLLAKLRQTFSNRNSRFENPEQVTSAEKISVTENEGFANIEYIGEKIHTPEELLKKSGINVSLFEIERVITNVWEQAGKQSDSSLYKTNLRQIKVILRRKAVSQITVETLIARLEKTGPIRSKIVYPKAKKKTAKRALEISLMDPHLGLLAFKGESDHAWTPELCAKLCTWAVDKLLELAKAHGPFDEIVFPFGNDFLHHDNLLHTTTKGTPQPEGVSYQHVYEKAIELAVSLIDRLCQVAPVRIIQVSGNHDQVTAFTLGHILRAYYRRDDNVTVQVDPSPYKFWRYGVNLVGFDHGHHVKPIRLAALMAHEAREFWSQTSYREWHLGDQHRKGTSSPVIMEEQGVSIEYLPALTPPNAWHRLKAFNWQQRGAMAFVWDHDEGPIARLQVNLNSYTGKPFKS